MLSQDGAFVMIADILGQRNLPSSSRTATAVHLAAAGPAANGVVSAVARQNGLTPAKAAGTGRLRA
jgi:hypothetical protein